MTTTLSRYIMDCLTEAIKEQQSIKEQLIGMIDDANMLKIIEHKARLTPNSNWQYKLRKDVFDVLLPIEVKGVLESNVEYWNRYSYDVKAYITKLLNKDETVSIARDIQKLSYQFRTN